MTRNPIIRGPLLNPREDGRVEFIADAVVVSDEHGRIAHVGPWRSELGDARRSDGIICPPFLDAHIHIPQHPIRGRFMEGVEPDPPEGRLIAGLNRNVFPAEARCADPQYAREVIRTFLDDTLAHGVIGGAAYMTVHREATQLALEMLPERWSVGLVLMNRNCPPDLRTDEANLERDLSELAEQFGRRLIVTDRFAVAVDPSLRRRAVAIAKHFDLMTQTHMDEQVPEKQLVERTLHPDAGSYANLYARDGLFDQPCIVAHCVQTRDEEFDLLRQRGCTIAHCPTSNTLLGSGIMPLDRVREHGLEYAICTDVGASPTTSLLAEMAQFLTVHAGRSRHATPGEALYRTTLAPARILGLEDRLGSFEAGKEMSFVELRLDAPIVQSADADQVISSLLSGPTDKVIRVTLRGRTEWERLLPSPGTPGEA
jgi:guanine deaminase